MDPGCLDLFGEGIGTVLVVVLVLLIVWFVLLPLILAVIDVMVLLFLALLSVVGRVLLRRPWVVEALADDGTRLTWRVVGWRASREFRDEAARLLSAGITPSGTSTKD